MKGYKGFDKDFKCKRKQFTVGEEFSVGEFDGALDIYHDNKNGLNFCKYPLEVFNYYQPTTSRFAEVETTGDVIDPNPDDLSNKSTVTYTNKLKICKEIGITDIISESIDYITRNACLTDQKTWFVWKDKKYYSAVTIVNDHSIASNEKYCSTATNIGNFSIAKNIGSFSASTNTGYKSLSKNSGDYSISSNTGNCSVAINEGEYSVATNTGNCSASANIGKFSVATNTGDASVAFNRGNSSIAFNAGEDSIAMNEGNYSIAANVGYCGAAVTKGDDSVAVSLGYDGMAKGSLGSWIIIAEFDRKNGSIKNIKSFKVDGKNILPDTFYKLKDGKPVIVDDNKN